MKKLILILLMLLWCGRAGAVTTYEVTVMPSGGNYTALQTAMNTNGCNLITSIVVNGSLTRGAIADGTALTQTTSLATGIAVSKTTTQMLIKTIVGTPNNSGTWWPTADTNDATNAYTPTTAGDSVQLDIKIDGAWSTPDSTAVSYPSFTTDETRYVNIYTTAQARHPGYYAPTTAYILQKSYQDSAVFGASIPFLRITGVQIENTHATVSSNTLAVVNGSNTAGDIRYEKCIFICNGGYVFFSNQETVIIRFVNTILISKKNLPYLINGKYNSATGQAFYNCVIIADSTNTTNKNACNDGSTYNITMKNCYCRASGTGVALATNVVDTSVATSDATGSSAGLQNVAYSTSSGAYFTNVTSESEDFHIGASSSLLNVGTDLSGTFTDDIDGQARPTGADTWDIGVDEYVAAGGGATSATIVTED